LQLLACDQPEWRPDPEHIAYNRQVLELTYYERDLRTAFDDPALEAQQRESDIRRLRGEHLIQVSLGLDGPEFAIGSE